MKKASLIIGIVVLIGLGILIWHSCGKKETDKTQRDQIVDEIPDKNNDKVVDENQDEQTDHEDTDTSKPSQKDEEDGFPEVETPAGDANDKTTPPSNSTNSGGSQNTTDKNTEEDDNESETPSFSLPLENDTGTYSPGIM